MQPKTALSRVYEGLTFAVLAITPSSTIAWSILAEAVQTIGSPPGANRESTPERSGKQFMFTSRSSETCTIQRIRSEKEMALDNSLAESDWVVEINPISWGSCLLVPFRMYYLALLLVLTCLFGFSPKRRGRHHRFRILHVICPPQFSSPGRTFVLCLH